MYLSLLSKLIDIVLFLSILILGRTVYLKNFMFKGIDELVYLLIMVPLSVNIVTCVHTVYIYVCVYSYLAYLGNSI